MFHKSVFKQCVRSNGMLWIVFTLIACLMQFFIMASYDAAAFSSISSAASGTILESFTSNLNSFLGTLEYFYTMVAILLPMVYTILSSTNLIVGEVDSGSMAYTLSTPIRRSAVVFTKAAYMIGSVALMFVIIALSGLGSAELTQHCVTDSHISDDVQAAAEAMDRTARYVKEHLYIIEEDPYAKKSGAQTRNMDEEAYGMYLEQAMLRDSYKAAAKQLTKDRKEFYKDYDGDDKDEIDKNFIEITQQELANDPSLMLSNREALAAGAEKMGLTVPAYKDYILELLDTPEDAEKAENTEKQTGDEEVPEEAAAVTDEGELFQLALSAAATELDMEASELADNLIWMKEDAAMTAQMAATGASRAVINQMINEAMVSQALSSDESIDFDMEVYLWLNFGCFLLILAFSAIGFFASCTFNRTGKAMVLGGGLPFLFFLFNLMQKMGDNLENFKYFTITTFYDTGAILALEDFAPGLLILTGISIVLYSAGCIIFCKKDLPL